MAFFIIEMVEGQDFCPSPRWSSTSCYTEWVQRLAREAPSWLASSFKLNAQQYGLPQHRVRLYTLGVNRLHTALPVSSLPRVPYSSPEQLWKRVLHPALPLNMEHCLCEQQQENLLVAKHIVLQRGSWTNPVYIEVGRSPLRAWGSVIRTDGSSATLRCHHEMGWLLWLDKDAWL